MKKRIYIVYTGGTLGMIKTAKGYAPKPGYLSSLMDAIAELADPTIPDYDIHEYDPLLDSSNMRPSDWLKIARDISNHYDEFDGLPDYDYDDIFIFIVDENGDFGN